MPAVMLSSATLGNLFTHGATVTKQYLLVATQAGKATRGLASHWTCVTDNSGISTYGLTALEREISPRSFAVGLWHTLSFYGVQR